VRLVQDWNFKLVTRGHDFGQIATKIAKRID
jgi:hypothetical protein